MLTSKIRVEKWLGHEIRFIEKMPGDWWGIAVDVTKALGIRNSRDVVSRIPESQKGVVITDTLGGKQEVSIISEKGIYRLIMRSRRKEAEAFQDWVFDIIRSLRQLTGLEGFQVFRMLDKEHQKAAMQKLRDSLREPVRVNFIKANTIVNKAISTRYGFKKMLKKDEMTPNMLVEREPILDDTVELMGVADRFGLPIKVSQTIYNKYVQ